MKDLHSYAWYAARVSPQLPQHAFKAVPARLLGGLVYLIVIVSGILTISLFDLNPWVNLIIALVLGASFAGIGFLGHEILHGTVVRKRWLSDLLGAIAFWPLNTGPLLWRKWHNLNHHVHTQEEHIDPDAWPNLEQLLQKPLLVRLAYRIPLSIRAMFNFISLSFTFTLQSINVFIKLIKEFKPKKRVVVWFQLILPWATWIGLMFLIGPIKWLFAFLIPLFVANFIIMSYISTNHRLNPLVPVNDPLANSLTVTVPKWVDILHFNFSYHTEHHLFPGISSKYYPLVKAEIKKMWPDRYHEMPLIRALIALWKTPRVYFHNNELIDPRKGNVFGSLGHGLDPTNITSRQAKVTEKD